MSGDKAILVTTVTTRMELTVEQLAAAFMELDDDAQARFFVEVARIERSWYGEKRTATMPHGWQPYAIGAHLRTCACSTDDAREFVQAIARGIAEGTHE